MADIVLVLHGQPSFEAMCAMDLLEISEWHQRAADRAKKEK